MPLKEKDFCSAFFLANARDWEGLRQISIRTFFDKMYILCFDFKKHY